MDTSQDTSKLKEPSKPEEKALEPAGTGNKTDKPEDSTKTENTVAEPEKPEEAKSMGFTTKIMIFFGFYMLSGVLYELFAPKSGLENGLAQGSKFKVHFRLSTSPEMPFHTAEIEYSPEFDPLTQEGTVTVPINPKIVSKSKSVINNHRFVSASFEFESKQLNRIFANHSVEFPLIEKQETFLDSLTAKQIELETETVRPSSDILFKSEISLFLVGPDNLKLDDTKLTSLRQLGVNTVALGKKAFPPFYLTDFWCSDKDLKPVTASTAQMELKVNVRFISPVLLNMLRGVEENSKAFRKSGLPDSKNILVELLKYNEVYYLVILFTVNVLHSLFQCLEVVEEVNYTRNLKKLDGVNSKEVVFSLAFQVSACIYYSFEKINFYYQLVNYLGIAVSVWKLRKIFTVSFSSAFPFISLANKIPYVDSATKRYEHEAIVLFSKWLLSPLAAGYFVYCYVYYFDQISFFHFIFKYIFYLFMVFGFILMTPQIYINYKMKSVENIPRLLFVYKFLDTIIDDLMVFALETPILKKISVFRDDVIFGILIVQMFIYRNKQKTD